MSMDGILSLSSFGSLLAVGLCLMLGACAPGKSSPGRLAYERQGDEIVVAGQLFHTGTPVVLWSDPGGYDAYRVERRFAPWQEAGWSRSQEKLNSPNRFSLRRHEWTDQELAQLRGGGWSLQQVQDKVDQFVIHYDVAGTARRCFEVLHDHRTLSVHFLLDVDGTIYQTLDVKERAWHAGTANDRSVGIEIANIGAYPPRQAQKVFDRWYERDEQGEIRLRLPERERKAIRTPDFVGRPDRPEPVTGSINGRTLVQYDLTPQQYKALIRLTAALGRVLPNMPLDFPRDEQGEIRLDRPLTEAELADFRGLLGHNHVIISKSDPGPAFQWERVAREARRLAGKRR